jgi:hypothetical protein
MVPYNINIISNQAVTGIFSERRLAFRLHGRRTHTTVGWGQ